MDLEDMIMWVLSIAFVVTIVLLIQGNFIDISLERQGADVQRAAINFINSISSSSDFLVKDANNIPVKNSFSLQSLADPSKILKASGCCDMLQYDYLLKVANFGKDAEEDGRTLYVSSIQPTANARSPVTNSNPEKFAYFSKMSACYLGSGYLPAASAERFVNVCENGKCSAGVASVEIAETPLSQLAFWISRTCNDDQNFVKQILIDKDDVETNSIRIDQANMQVCMKIKGSENELCKKYVCTSSVEEKRSAELETFEKSNALGYKIGTNCFNVILEKTSSGPAITLPPYTESQNFVGALPANFDRWTEQTSSKFVAAKTKSALKPLSNDPCVSVSDDPDEQNADVSEISRSSVRLDNMEPMCNVMFSSFTDDEGNTKSEIDAKIYKKISFAVTYDGPVDINLVLLLDNGEGREESTCKIPLEYKTPNYWELKTVEIDKIQPSNLCYKSFLDKKIVKSIGFERGAFGENKNAPRIWIDTLFFSK